MKALQASVATTGGYSWTFMDCPQSNGGKWLNPKIINRKSADRRIKKSVTSDEWRVTSKRIDFGLTQSKTQNGPMTRWPDDPILRAVTSDTVRRSKPEGGNAGRADDQLPA